MALVLGTAGCRSESEVTVVGPNAFGTLTGTVTTIVDSAGRFRQDRSGVVVTLDNNVVADTTNVYGQWRIDNVLIGLHSLTYSLPGYPTQRLNFVFVAGASITDLSNRVAMITPPTFTVTLAAVTQPTWQQSGALYGELDGTVPQGVSVNLFVLRSRRDHPSIEDPGSYDTSFTIQVIPTNGQTSNIVFSKQLSYDGPTIGGTKPGEKIVLRAYPFFVTNRLPDESGVMRTVGLGLPSNEISFVRD